MKREKCFSTKGKRKSKRKENIEKKRQKENEKWRKKKKKRNNSKNQKIKKNSKMQNLKRFLRFFGFTRKIFNDLMVSHCCCFFFWWNPRRFPWFVSGCLFPKKINNPFGSSHSFQMRGRNFHWTWRTFSVRSASLTIITFLPYLGGARERLIRPSSPLPPPLQNLQTASPLSTTHSLTVYACVCVCVFPLFTKPSKSQFCSKVDRRSLNACKTLFFSHMSPHLGQKDNDFSKNWPTFTECL